ncbi:hypothetical protein [Leptospira saintgironsiae]|nr:hypothetical protein [Leptospira saintgironsiae]
MQRLICIITITLLSIPYEAKGPVKSNNNNDIDLTGLYFRIDQNEYGDTTMHLTFTKRTDSKYNISFILAGNGVELRSLTLKCNKMNNCKMFHSSGKLFMDFDIVSKDIVLKISPKSELAEVIDNGARFSQDIDNKPFQYEPLE